MRIRWLGALGLAAAVVLVWGYRTEWGETAVVQPIQFPHKTHVQQLSLQCTNCHQRAQKDTVAGRPPTMLCVACHAAARKTDETRKVLAFGEKGVEIPWKRVWRLPSSVFFSHRTHVAVAQVTCQTCHGPMETLDRPPARPLRALAMNDCIACHERRGWPEEAKQVAGRRLSTDCDSCHR